MRVSLAFNLSEFHSLLSSLYHLPVVFASLSLPSNGFIGVPHRRFTWVTWDMKFSMYRTALYTSPGGGTAVIDPKPIFAQSQACVDDAVAALVLPSDPPSSLSWSHFTQSYKHVWCSWSHQIQAQFQPGPYQCLASFPVSTPLCPKPNL